MMEKTFFSFQEAAEFLGCSRSFLERLVARGEMPSYKIGKGRKGRRLFDKEELVEWVKSHRDDTQAKLKQAEAGEIPKKKGRRKKRKSPP